MVGLIEGVSSPYSHDDDNGQSGQLVIYVGIQIRHVRHS